MPSIICACESGSSRISAWRCRRCPISMIWRKKGHGSDFWKRCEKPLLQMNAGKFWIVVRAGGLPFPRSPCGRIWETTLNPFWRIHCADRSGVMKQSLPSAHSASQPPPVQQIQSTKCDLQVGVSELMKSLKSAKADQESLFKTWREKSGSLDSVRLGRSRMIWDLSEV